MIVTKTLKTEAALQIRDHAMALILLCHRLLRNAILPKEINALATCAQKY